MNEEVFAEWLRRQGHRVIKSESSYWYDAGPRVYQAFPYGNIIQPSEAELRKLMMRNGVVALRYSTPVSRPQGIISYHVILNSPYDLQDLAHQTRSNIKKGLRACQVEQISLQRLAEEGWILQQDTLKRQRRLSSMSEEQWKRICLSAIDLPGFIAWGAIVDNKLAASIFTVRIGDKFYVPYAQCLEKYLYINVNHALFYQASCEMISQTDIREIFFSLHSLDAPESVNEFKFRMGFSARPVRQRVVVHPILAPLASKTSHQFLQRLTQRYPESNLVSKAEGMLRFHLFGKMPIEDQEWPKCLSDFRGTCFAAASPGLEKPPEQIEILLEEGEGVNYGRS
jgi:hypothetical protein